MNNERPADLEFTTEFCITAEWTPASGDGVFSKRTEGECEHSWIPDDPNAEVPSLDDTTAEFRSSVLESDAESIAEEVPEIPLDPDTEGCATGEVSVEVAREIPEALGIDQYRSAIRDQIREQRSDGLLPDTIEIAVAFVDGDMLASEQRDWPVMVHHQFASDDDREPPRVEREEEYPRGYPEYPETLQYDWLSLIGVDRVGIGWYMDYAATTAVLRGFAPTVDKGPNTIRPAPVDHSPTPLPTEVEERENGDERGLTAVEYGEPKHPDGLVGAPGGVLAEIAVFSDTRIMVDGAERPAVPAALAGLDYEQDVQPMLRELEMEPNRAVRWLVKPARFGMAHWLADDLSNDLYNSALEYEHATVFALRKFGYTNEEVAARLDRHPKKIAQLYTEALNDGTLAGSRTWEDWSEVSDDWPANTGAEQTQQRIDETEQTGLSGYY